MDRVDGDLVSVTGDAADDTVAFYDVAGPRAATVVVPPNRTARVSRRRPRSRARARTIKRVKPLGQRRWKRESGSHRQARVENAFFRYKSSPCDLSQELATCLDRHSIAHTPGAP